MQDWLTIAGSILSGSTLTWLITFWANRKTNARKEGAAAESMEHANERNQVDWLEQRLLQRDSKIDGLYNELRKEQAEKIQLIHEKHKLELRMREAEVRRCDVRGCKERRPPSEY